MFDVISTAGTGLQTYHTWLDAISNNIANMNDTSSPSQQTFHEEYVQIGQIGGGEGNLGQGVAVTGMSEGPDGYLTQDPENPLADKAGYVRHADVDLNDQMGDMIMAQRGFEAQANVISQATQAYQAAIAIGKGD